MKNLVYLVAGLLKTLIRKKSPVNFNDMATTRPVSHLFGADRGTPIDRYYIENFFQRNGSRIKGQVLEVGDSSYSRKFSRGQVESFNVLQHAALGDGAATIVGDLTDTATLPANAFDCFICAQTLQYTFEVQKAVAGAHYLLKPGGVMLATVPGISQISRFDADRYGEYWRFTTDSMKRLFEPVFGEGVEVASVGNVLSATAFLQGIALEDLSDPTLLDRHDPDYQMIVTIVARKACG
ncbi:MAG: methyltransferase domain-containing protein [Pseudomonadota bacterium]